nr:L-aspartate oxidase [Aquibacillus saliphilus]
MGVIKIKSVDIVIIGSGLAALSLADRLSNDKNVIVLTKGKKYNSNSVRAQGGVAASMSEQDDWENHFRDTMVAGCNVNNHEAVELMVRQGPGFITKWIEEGLGFDRDRFGKILLGKEGAHGKRRILHAGGDATGNVVMEFLMNRLQGKVTIVESEMVLDLIVEEGNCCGVITSNDQNRISTFHANHVILATGGCGGLYEVTSNDETVTGDGIALAYRAGAKMVDLEFVQFHPTMLNTTSDISHGLISEAVRGEGAILITEKGKRVMKDIHPLEDLAPRDIVARVIQSEINNGNKVYLDISMIDNFETKFPTITSICQHATIDVKAKLLPVAPGAHFLMGGIKTNLSGLTTVKGLYAIGEVACTGVHGANRLASNSLLEGIVFSNMLANYLLNLKEETTLPLVSLRATGSVRFKVDQLPTKAEIRRLMTAYVGIERTEQGLVHAKQWIEQFELNSNQKLDITKISKQDVEKINMLTTCKLIIKSALERTESRGAHYRNDFPVADNEWINKQIIRQRSIMRDKQKVKTEVVK